jgi:hypothetical protein
MLMLVATASMFEVSEPLTAAESDGNAAVADAVVRPSQKKQSPPLPTPTAVAGEAAIAAMWE